MPVSEGDYLLGSAGLAAIAISLAYTAVLARRRLLPDWSGPPARLAESIITIATLVVLLELLGTASILTGPAIVIACLLVAAAKAFWARSSPKASSETPGGSGATRLEIGIAIGVALLLLAQWAQPTFLALDRGIYGGDSLWYHMPFAADIARTGSTTALHFVDPLYLNWFYPQNSELIHAAGITLYGNDFLSPLLNLAWLSLALLAAWCIGRPFKAGAISLTAVAILLAADLMFSRQPGNANNDIVALALLLAAVAILITASDLRGGPYAPLAVAGLAAGLAMGTKLTVLVPVLALSAGVVVIAASGTRLRTAGVWIGGLVVGGGYWYVRNLIVAGNPLPWNKIGIGPAALPRSEELDGRDPFSIVHYATNTTVWREFFFPGLHERFGDFWPLLLVLAAAAVVAMIVRGTPLLRMLAVVTAITAVAYLLTPLSAAGPDGAPLAFRLNLRYLAPALAIGLVLLATPAAWWPKRERESRFILLGVLVVVLLLGQSPLAALDDGYLLGSLAIVVLAAAVLAIGPLRARGIAPAGIAAGAALLVLAAVTSGWHLERDYEKHRYALDAPHYPSHEHPSQELNAGLGDAYEWARGIRDTKIGLAGTFGALFQYGLYGPDSSNDVVFVGDRGARGSFRPIADCRAWREALNQGGYEYVVLTPNYNQDEPDIVGTEFEHAWTAADPAAKLVVQGPVLITADDKPSPGVGVFRISGELNPEMCPD